MSFIGTQTAPGRLLSILWFTLKILVLLLITYSVTGIYSFKRSISKQAQLNVTSLVSFQQSQTYDWERAQFIIDLKINLSTLSRWNMRQIYACVFAEFKNNEGEVSRATVWDKLLKPEENGKLEGWDINHAGIKTPYPLRDLYKSLKGQEIKFIMALNYLPWYGMTITENVVETNFTMPSQYVIFDKSKLRN